MAPECQIRERASSQNDLAAAQTLPFQPRNSDTDPATVAVRTLADNSRPLLIVRANDPPLQPPRKPEMMIFKPNPILNAGSEKDPSCNEQVPELTQAVPRS